MSTWPATQVFNISRDKSVLCCCVSVPRVLRRGRDSAVMEGRLSEGGRETLRLTGH